MSWNEKWKELSCHKFLITANGKIFSKELSLLLLLLLFQKIPCFHIWKNVFRKKHLKILFGHLSSTKLKTTLDFWPRCLPKQMQPFLAKINLEWCLSTNFTHCVKRARIRNYFGPYFPAFGLNAERYSVSLRTQAEWGEIRTRITPNTDTFYAVTFCRFSSFFLYFHLENKCNHEIEYPQNIRNNIS